MPQRAIPGGIGVGGSAMARFFHPSAKIREQWPQNDKRRLTNVVVMGEGVMRIRNKDQMCYLVRINEINDGTIFHIAKKNFKIDTAPAVPFDSETRLPMAPAINASVVNEIRAAGRDVVSNVGHLSRGATREEIEEIRRNGIEVDNDNEPAPENTVPPQDAPSIDGTWEKPMYCNRRANPNFLDTAGRFKNHQWDQIASYTEFELFQMCFPEDYIRDVVIPRRTRISARR
jgi:hypothetical protein